MGFLGRLFGKKRGFSGFMKNRVKFLYEHPETLVEIEFSNKSGTLTNIWVEPACEEIDLDAANEYKIVSHDRSFRIEFGDDNHIVLWLQLSFGFKLYKRPSSDALQNSNEWILHYDSSDVN